MDTLGVCGAPSTAADNGVVMVKEPRLERVSENQESPRRRSLGVMALNCRTDGLKWTQRESGR